MECLLFIRHNLSDALAPKGRVWRKRTEGLQVTANNLITSMPMRIDAVAKADGYKTKY